MTIINFEDWAKLEMRVGRVKRINKDKIIINYNDKDYLTRAKINVKEDDLIVVGFIGDEIIIPLVNKNIPLSPEKDIEVGSRVR